jgi:cyclase
MHASLLVALRHFLMDDAAARGHPLDVARAERAAIAEAVTVFDRAGQDVCDCFNAAVWMPRESSQILLGIVVAKVIEEQKWIKLLRVSETEGALQLDTRSLERGLGTEDAFDGTDGHGCSILCAMRNTTIARVLVWALLFGGLGVAYIHGQFGQTPAKLDLTKVKDDLFVIHNDFVPGNVTALMTNEGVVLVDDKFDVDHDNIMAQLKKATNQPVKYVINTHHHGDHSGGNEKLLALNVQVLASEEAREKMVDGKQGGLPTIAFDHHAHVYLGGKNVELYHFGRAHTNGDVVVLFPAQRVLAAGDMFTFGDATPQLIDYAGGGSAKEWTKTLDEVLQLDFDTVVPGHGPVTTKQELRKFRDSTVALRTRIHDMIVQKRPRADIAKMLQTEFHWAELHLNVSLDGALAELR